MSEKQKADKKPAEQPKAEAAHPAEGEQKLSPAELKKRAKAEKAARRAAAVAAKAGEGDGDAVVAGPSGTNGAANGEPRAPKQAQQQKPKGDQRSQQQQQRGQVQQRQQAGGHQRTPSGQQQQQQLPVRPHGSAQATVEKKEPVKKQENKNVELFSHLYLQPRRHDMDGASKDVHPSVLALGFQIGTYEICGGNARCVGMLKAFRDAIQDYQTPGGTSLARHMTQHYLSPQIEFLKSCRPISESMGNAIRWLKKLVVEIDPSIPEHEAKDYLCENIDTFIRERIIVTDQAIATAASKQIKNGSVVLTYANSSIVEKTILQAQANGTQFRVICLDSRPLFEGRNLALSLTNAGLDVEYLPFSGMQRAITDSTVMLTGAHSMLSNGHMQSRVGTAAVAMAARKAHLPVIVCCESVKFSGKMALDSIVQNEVAPAEEFLASVPAATSIIKSDTDDDEDNPKLKTLHDWKNVPNLQILNLMYDTTPAEYLSLIICEYGSVPPTSVPVVHRLANEAE